MLFLTFAMNTTQVGFKLTTFSHKLCICSVIDSCQLFLHKVSSHHYSYRCQNMGPKYPSSRRKEWVKSELSCMLLLTLKLASQRIHFASQLQVLKNPCDHALDRKQRRLHLALIFECTFHQLIAHVLSCFFSKLFCLI